MCVYPKLLYVCTPMAISRNILFIVVFEMEEEIRQTSTSPYNAKIKCQIHKQQKQLMLIYI